MPYQIYLELILVALLLGAASFDLSQRKIPNRLLLPGVLCALLLHLFSGTPMNVISTGLAGMATGFGLFLPLYLVRGMAAGDVKLMATVGAFCGPAQTLTIAIATFCIGGILALLIVAMSGRTREAMANMSALLRPIMLRLAKTAQPPGPGAPASVGNMPYGLAIALGTFAVLYLAPYFSIS
jgi:prepilin peptidase CpaA